MVVVGVVVVLVLPYKSSGCREFHIEIWTASSDCGEGLASGRSGKRQVQASSKEFERAHDQTTRRKSVTYLKIRQGREIRGKRIAEIRRDELGCGGGCLG